MSSRSKYIAKPLGSSLRESYGAKNRTSSVQEAVTYPVKDNHNKNLSKTNNVKQPIERIFDEIIERTQDESPNTVIEALLQPLFESSQTIFWSFLPKINALYSASFQVTVPASNSVLYTGLKSRIPISTKNQSQHPAFQLAIDTKIIPPNMPVLLIPVMTRDSNPLGVMEFTRKIDNPFTSQDLANATTVMNKFRTYSAFMFTGQQTINTAYDLVHIESLANTIKLVTTSLSKLFRCRKAELWLYRRKKQVYMRFDESNTEEVLINPQKLGIVGHCLNTCSVVNEKACGDHPDFCQITDGFPSEAVLAVPYIEKTKRIWAVVLRGRISPSYFSPNDEAKLNAVAEFAIQSVSSAVLPNKVDSQTQNFQERLSALLEVAEALSGVLQIEQLIPLIMSKSCSLLNAERCSLFLVDVIKKELITTFHGGLSNAIRIPLNKGIAGATATTGEVVNIEDAYQDSRFDRSIDAKTGYRTKSILTMPIYNNRGEIIGVTEMINKCDSGIFDNEDIRLLMGFNVFCGISLDNAKLYEASLNLAHQVRTFVDMSTALNQATALRNILKEILESAEKVVNGTRAILYRYEENRITELVSVGDKKRFGPLFAAETAELRQQKIYDKDEIAERLQSLNLENAVKEMLGKTEDDIPPEEGQHSLAAANSEMTRSRVQKVLMEEQPMGQIEMQVNDVLCCIPLYNSEGEVIGVLELSSAQKMMNEDLKLLDCFAIFAAVSLERSDLKDVATLGAQELELKEWLTDPERADCEAIPKKLALDLVDNAKLWRIDFDAPSWAGMPFFKVVFAIFERFRFRQNYGITNEKLFRFLCELRDTYNPVPYHNWRHAIDVLQFVTYELIISGIEKKLTNLELFAIIIAALCHDANHDGFTNVFNVKAETPLGILFKNQSVMETHHCEVAIGILSKEETNLFANLSSADFKATWTLIIQLILATDMAKHFNLLKEFNGLMDENKWDPVGNHEHRVLMMQLLLKTADISNVSRPFELADRWCDVLCEEFFRQGDLEMASGMEYTSDLNDREHLNKPKSQIGFYTFVCLPLYQADARMCPELDVNVKQVQSNLAVWKAAADEKAKAEQEAAAAAEKK